MWPPAFRFVKRLRRSIRRKNVQLHSIQATSTRPILCGVQQGAADTPVTRIFPHHQLFHPRESPRQMHTPTRRYHFCHMHYADETRLAIYPGEVLLLIFQPARIFRHGAPHRHRRLQTVRGPGTMFRIHQANKYFKAIMVRLAQWANPSREAGQGTRHGATRRPGGAGYRRAAPGNGRTTRFRPSGLCHEC